MKLYTKKEILPILIILAMVVIGGYLYPSLPDLIPGHWDINGEIDGWMGKAFAIYFFPGLIIGLYLLSSFAPLMDPHKTNIESFAGLYFGLKLVFILFLSSLFLMTLYAAMGYEVNTGRYVALGIAILFAYIGYMLPHVKKNYMIGIRLPWTLHSEVAWKKTHKVGGFLFIVLAIVIALASFLGGAQAFATIISSIIVFLITMVVYSYMEFRKLEK